MFKEIEILKGGLEIEIQDHPLKNIIYTTFF